MGTWGKELALQHKVGVCGNSTLPSLHCSNSPEAPHAVASPAHHSQMWLALESAQLQVKGGTRMGTGRGWPQDGTEC